MQANVDVQVTDFAKGDDVSVVITACFRHLRVAKSHILSEKLEINTIQVAQCFPQNFLC